MKIKAEVVQMGWRYHIQLSILGLMVFYSQVSYTNKDEADKKLSALKEGGWVE